MEKYMKKPPYKEARGRPKGSTKIDHPKKKGDWVCLPITSRQAAYSYAWLHGYKIKTWINNGQLVVERIS